MTVAIIWCAIGAVVLLDGTRLFGRPPSVGVAVMAIVLWPIAVYAAISNAFEGKRK